ncbi:hypothetical protein B0H10DRAFT_2221797 [Mycena sp. CBHHK59/15]|nr:hypothetical protein B0H10DRAFT_2221797 [Mycena sp. CBHHK59/15]
MPKNSHPTTRTSKSQNYHHLMTVVSDADYTSKLGRDQDVPMPDRLRYVKTTDILHKIIRDLDLRLRAECFPASSRVPQVSGMALNCTFSFVLMLMKPHAALKSLVVHELPSNSFNVLISSSARQAHQSPEQKRMRQGKKSGASFEDFAAQAQNARALPVSREQAARPPCVLRFKSARLASDSAHR